MSYSFGGCNQRMLEGRGRVFWSFKQIATKVRSYRYLSRLNYLKRLLAGLIRIYDYGGEGGWWRRRRHAITRKTHDSRGLSVRAPVTCRRLMYLSFITRTTITQWSLASCMQQPDWKFISWSRPDWSVVYFVQDDIIGSYNAAWQSGSLNNENCYISKG